MLATEKDDFAVDWEDPADAALTWMWDHMHNPRPVVPFARRIAETVDQGVTNSRTRWVNGYPYQTSIELPMPPAEVFERGLSIWPDEYVPRIREWCGKVRATDFDAMSSDELLAALDALVPESVATFRLTMVMVIAFMMPTMQLVAFSEQELGPDGPRLVGNALQGSDNATSSAGLGLSKLADVARRSPEVAARVKAGDIAGIASVPGGPEFAVELDRFLDEFGWRLESWTFVDIPTWAEDPAVALQLVARYLDESSASPSEAVARSSRDRDAALEEIEGRLEPPKREQFLAMMDAAAQHVSISESRAHWQLTIIGVLRRPILALGRKLVTLGALAEPDDVLYLEWGEAERAVRHPDASTAALVAERRAEMERWRALTPPPFVGAPPDVSEVPQQMQMVMKHFFGMGAMPSTEEREVTGFGASKGTATGRARVIKSLSESDRLEPGDILVCVSTAAPWTPLFAVAGGVVTDSGGVLSHSAICAREFAIPAVVGTQVGTQRIPDGAMVTVDGEKGTVRIVG